MGKRLIQQRRGKGSIYKALKHNSKGNARHAKVNQDEAGVIKDIVTNKLHSAPLLVVKYSDGERLMIAPEGVRVGEKIISGPKAPVSNGNTVALKNVPEGTAIFNIEKNPGYGGKFCKTSGSAARVITNLKDKI
ncbi:50S ribosomal protein L2, partial [Candidatus Woesearchaeota archaeon]|nr:50S ribosomal protein L2 [Candidatus Woesearchaeota archaeon]